MPECTWRRPEAFLKTVVLPLVPGILVSSFRPTTIQSVRITWYPFFHRTTVLPLMHILSACLNVLFVRFTVSLFISQCAVGWCNMHSCRIGRSRLTGIDMNSAFRNCLTQTKVQRKAAFKAEWVQHDLISELLLWPWLSICVFTGEYICDICVALSIECLLSQNRGVFREPVKAIHLQVVALFSPCAWTHCLHTDNAPEVPTSSRKPKRTFSWVPTHAAQRFNQLLTKFRQNSSTVDWTIVYFGHGHKIKPSHRAARNPAVGE